MFQEVLFLLPSCRRVPLRDLCMHAAIITICFIVDPHKCHLNVSDFLAFRDEAILLAFQSQLYLNHVVFVFISML